MVRELVHDPILLSRVSEPAGKEDWGIAQDLLETLIFHEKGCVGMAANMIGITKRIIAFNITIRRIGLHRKVKDRTYFVIF